MWLHFSQWLWMGMFQAIFTLGHKALLYTLFCSLSSSVSWITWKKSITAPGSCISRHSFSSSYVLTLAKSVTTLRCLHWNCHACIHIRDINWASSEYELARLRALNTQLQTVPGPTAYVARDTLWLLFLSYFKGSMTDHRRPHFSYKHWTNSQMKQE